MITIRQAFVSLYMPNRPQLAPLTVQRYLDEIRRWEVRTPNPLLSQITTETFNLYRAECLSAGLKPTTIESGIRTILQVLRLCGPEQERRQGLGLITRVPFVGQSLRQSTPLLPTPSVEDLRAAWVHSTSAIWPTTGGADPANFWRAWIGISFVTGLRLSDALAARRSQISADIFTVTARKTGITHIFPIPAWLLVELYQLPVWNSKLFPCRFLPCFVRRELRRISVVAQVPAITPHGMRRAAITEWSAISSDCGSILHGQGLGIRSRYVNPVRLLRKHLPDFPDLTQS